MVKTKNKKIKNQRGFTLIEILLVVVIIGILASLVVPRLAGRSEEARLHAAKADVDGGLSLALDLYEVDNGAYPSQLEDLVTKPVNAEKWRGPYIKRRLPKDPWGQSYRYSFPGKQNSEGYDLFSVGPDHQEGTGDDIGNWDQPAVSSAV